MSATLDALQSGSGPFLTTVVLVEGYPDAITDGDPAAVVTALAACTLPGFTDYITAIGGLRVTWDMRGEIDPRDPFTDPPALKFEVMEALDDQGDLTDRFGMMVHRRGGGDETFLRETCDCNDTTLHVLSNDAFDAFGLVNVGPEAIVYTTRSNSPERFTGLTRGVYNPFHTSTGARFARHHEAIDINTQTGDPIGVKLPPRVTEYLRGFVGRGVAVYLLMEDPATGALTPPDDGGHRGFVGYVHGVEQTKTGATVVSCEHGLRRIYETVLLRDPFTAQIAEGITLTTGQTFSASTVRQNGGTTTSNEADDLVVVAGAPADAYEIQAGRYTVYELGDRINAWLLQAKTDTNLTFEVRYYGVTPTSGGTLRSRLAQRDATAGASIIRRTKLRFPSAYMARFCGWENGQQEVELVSTVQTDSKDSPYPPMRLYIGGGEDNELQPLELKNPRGSWQTQQSLLPVALRDPSGLVDGILKVGSSGYIQVQYISDTSVKYMTAGIPNFFPPNELGFNALELNVETDFDLSLSQVVVIDDTLRSVFFRVLLSTGTANFNNNPYDSLGEQLGCAIPYSMVEWEGEDIDDDFNVLEHGDRRMCVKIDKPTRFVDLFVGHLEVRFAFLYWGAGRIRIGSWTTPIAGYATLQLDESNKAVPIDQAEGDLQRAVAREDFESIFNVVKFEHGEQADGSTADVVTIIDGPSYRDHGPRGRTIKLRSATTRGAVGDDLRALMASFSGAMPIVSRPFTRTRRTISAALFEQAMLGATGALTDKFLRSPVTGLRYDPLTGTGGVIGWPVFVTGHRFDWGAPAYNGEDMRPALGDVDVMMLPPNTAAPYCPSATVDHTAANAGYDAGLKKLTILAHMHSEASHAADASHLPATYKCRVTQLDPDDPATALTWQDVVAAQAGNTITLTTGLAGWDNTKRYRVTFDDYVTNITAQEAFAHQADDGDGLVADLRQPYSMIYTGSGQLGQYTAAVQEVAPSLYAEELIGDGVALCVGGAKDIADLSNNAVGYKTVLQTAQMYDTLRTFGGGGTFELIDCFELGLSCGRLPVNLKRRLFATLMFRSTDGADAIVRLTVARMWPSGDSRDDVVFTDPYVQMEFTRTSMTMGHSDEEVAEIRHLDLGEGTFSGLAWCSVEINNKVEMAGIAQMALGAMEAA